MRNSRHSINVLNGTEITVLRAIRVLNPDARATAAARSPWSSQDPASLAFLELLSLLFDTDPFIVRLRPAEDAFLTLFELQVLYAVSECNAGNDNTIEELLEWWLPAEKMAFGREKMNNVVNALRRKGIALNCSSRIRNYFLEFVINRIEASHTVEPHRRADGWRHDRSRTVTIH